jgi:hypothetical protein
MNTTLLTRVDEQNHNHPPSHPRVSLPDRVALHVGLALITWSRRPHTPPPVREHNAHARHERERYLRRREEQVQLDMYVSRPWR